MPRPKVLTTLLRAQACRHRVGAPMRAAVLAASVVLAAGLPVAAQAPRLPISIRGDQSTITLEFAGRYQGDTFRPKVVRTPPAYDPATKRLYVISLARRAIEILDIADPTHPTKVGAITDPSGRLGIPTSLAFLDGVLAVSLMDFTRLQAGQVAFLDVDGRQVGRPVPVGVQPWVMAPTADGRRLVLANAGEELMGVDPEGTISVVTVQRTGGEGEDRVAGRAVTLDFHGFDRDAGALVGSGLRLGRPGTSLSKGLEPQGVAVSADGRTAWVTLQRNNALARVVLDPPAIADLIPFGSKDHMQPGQGLDASDRDGAVRIRNWPVHGLYQPDGIAAYRAGGAEYLVTANEGDPWDTDSDGSDTRVEDLTLDPTAFPDPEIKEASQLGRLRVSRLGADTDGDGDVDRLYAFGGRSFAIWSEAGQLLFDSGDAFERITGDALPGDFNSPEDANRFDDRSDDRGPEPEQVAVGRVGSHTYAFVTLERVGGIVAYDVTDPNHPHFETYVNSRNFAVDPAKVCHKGDTPSAACRDAGDLEPETVKVIAASESPTGVPLLVVTHKASDSVVFYRITAASADRRE